MDVSVVAHPVPRHLDFCFADVTCRHAIRDARARLLAADFGHSFGVELHEAPMIRPGDKTPLAAGMAINIEPMTFDAEGAC